MATIFYSDQLFTTLFQQCSKTLLAFLVNRVRCAETAQDLSQETFLRLLRKDGIVHDDNLGSYLFRIADRLAIDYLHKSRYSNRTEVLHDNLLCPKLLPDEMMGLRQQCQILLDTINALQKKNPACIFIAEN